MIHCIIRKDDGENAPIKDNFIFRQEFEYIYKFNHLTGEVFLTKSFTAKTSEAILVKAPWNWNKFADQFKISYEEHIMDLLAELMSPEHPHDYTIDSDGKTVVIRNENNDMEYTIKAQPNKIEIEEKQRR